MVRFWLAHAQPLKVLLSLCLDFHTISAHRLRIYRSSSATLLNVTPGCFLASSTRAKNSALDISAESFSFSAASFRRYFTARFNRFSSSAMMLILRSISAFNSIEVIILVFKFTCKDTTIFHNCNNPSVHANGNKPTPRNPSNYTQTWENVLMCE